MKRQWPTTLLCRKAMTSAFGTFCWLGQACQDHPSALDWVVTERLTWLPLSRSHPLGWQTVVAKHQGWQDEHHDRLPGPSTTHRGAEVTPGASLSMLSSCIWNLGVFPDDARASHCGFALWNQRVIPILNRLWCFYSPILQVFLKVPCKPQCTAWTNNARLLGHCWTSSPNLFWPHV